jgi:hypothetical protein
MGAVEGPHTSVGSGGAERIWRTVANLHPLQLGGLTAPHENPLEV